MLQQHKARHSRIVMRISKTGSKPQHADIERATVMTWLLTLCLRQDNYRPGLSCCNLNLQKNTTVVSCQCCRSCDQSGWLTTRRRPRLDKMDAIVNYTSNIDINSLHHHLITNNKSTIILVHNKSIHSKFILLQENHKHMKDNGGDIVWKLLQIVQVL